MSTSVGMKTIKKQPAISTGDRRFEQSLLSLDHTCQAILDRAYAPASGDADAAYWQLRLRNVATPLSLALTEYKGPRRFHNHYRHRADDASVLHPVLEHPVEMLAQVARTALSHCYHDLVGIRDAGLNTMRNTLERAIQQFLLEYETQRG